MRSYSSRRSEVAGWGLVAVLLAVLGVLAYMWFSISSPTLAKQQVATTTPAPKAPQQTPAQIAANEWTANGGKPNAALGLSTIPTQEKIIDAWIADEQQRYAYLDEPVGNIPSELQAGENPAQIFPAITTEAVNPILTSELEFLANVKIDRLNGPTSYNIHSVKVTALTSTTASVEACVTDTGTTTQSGAPGPLDLDGGPGGSRGTTTFVLQGGKWLMQGGQSVGVKSC